MVMAPEKPIRSESASPKQRRIWRYFQIIGAALVVASVVVAVLPGRASAAGLSNATVTLAVNGAKGLVTATNPLSGGQLITVTVGANTTMDRPSLEAAGFPSGAVPIKVLECADAGGSSANLPTKPTGCEPETIDSIAGARADGSMIISGFTVLALPDAALGASSGTVCNSQVDCVLGIFSNQNDFTKPHIFSAPFNVSPNSEANAGSSGSSSQPGSGPTAGSNPPSGASAAVSVAPGTLAYTGTSALFYVLLGSGMTLLLVGTLLRLSRRRAS
jgi:hypothetical protein